MKIPAVDLKKQNDNLKTELNEALRRTIERSSFILGQDVETFEKKFAEYIGTGHAVGVASGTAALQLPLMALGIGPQDEVIVPAMTFFATGEVVAQVGARPVFADVDPETWTIDPVEVERRITRHTKAIMPVHLYGHPADMDALQKIADRHHLHIIEDCAHSPGALFRGRKTGSFGAFGAFSFYPCKNLGALGDAGLITTSSDELALLCREYRDHGSTQKFQHNRIGTNNRMDGIQAAALLVKLPHLDGWNQARNRIAKTYSSLLSRIPAKLPREKESVFHVFHIFQMLVENRDELFAYLSGKGVGVNLHYPVPMHLHPGFAYLGYKAGDFPVAEELAKTTISLPCYPELTDEEARMVASLVLEYYRKKGAGSGKPPWTPHAVFHLPADGKPKEAQAIGRSEP